MRTIVIIVALLFTSTLKANQAGHQDNIGKAIEFLKFACVTSGKMEKLNVEGGTKLTLRGIFSSGVQAAVSFTQEELEGLAVATSEFSANQASEMRECMKPHINKIINKIIEVKTAPTKSQSKDEPVNIAVNNKYFIEKEFNNVLMAYAQYPDQEFYFANIQQKLEEEFVINLSKAKVAHYSNLAFDNGLLIKIDDPCLDITAYKITAKGLNYALSNELLK